VPATWTTPPIEAGYNYPNAVNVANGSNTACASANDYCVFNRPATVRGAPYYYTISKLQYCSGKNTAGFGVDPCQDRYDQAAGFRYARYGNGPGLDPQSFTRVDIVPTTPTFPSGRTYAEEMTNFAKWYTFYRTRILSMQTATGNAFSALSEKDARVGFHTLRYGTPNGGITYVPNGNINGNPFLNVVDFTAGNKDTWFNAVYGLKANFSTPLPEAVWRIGEYFSNSGNSGLPGAKDTGVLRTLQSQAEFLKTADQLSTIPPSWAPYVDSSFLAKMV